MKIHRLAPALTALAVLSTATSAFAAFSPTVAGTYEYTDTANWSGSTIDNSFNTTITGNQTITFDEDYTLSGSLSISNTGLFTHTFIGTGANRTVTLGGGISLGSNSSNTNTNTVTLGSTTDGQRLNIDLGAASRTAFVGTNRSMEILNVISSTSGNYSITKTGAGTLLLSNAANTFTGSVNIGASSQVGGVLAVTKLANTGENSSIGAGVGQIGFGGTATGTLRYVGTGDSTNRGLLIGGAGAIIDASGTGAINFTNSASQLNGSTGSARTFTLKGTNTDNNTMGASFINAGTGGTVSLLKEGAGTWVLTGNNTYTGDTTVSEGKLAIGADNRLGDTTRLVMNGGTFSTQGFSETLGTLQLTANSIIDLGNNATGSALAFSNSASELWSASMSLSIVNFTDGIDSVFFGTGGLTGDQLAQIRINGTHYGALDGSGFLVLGAAIPEPSAFALLAGLGCLLLAGSRRQRRAA